jgi:MFS family permease
VPLPPSHSPPEQPPPDVPLDYSAPPPEESPWRVGTLSYTRAGLVTLFFWLLWGDFAWSVRDRSLGTVLQLLLVKFKASDTVAGLLVGTFPAAIGLVLGPIISYRSDHYRSRLGRRLPFLFISAPVAAIAIVGLGFSPWLGGALHKMLGAHSPGLFPSVLIVLGAWWIVFDFATAVTNSVFGALINDVVPHGVLGRFFALFRAVSLLVGIAFNYWLLAKAEEHYQWMFAAVGAIYGIGVVWMCCQVREGEYPPSPPLEGTILSRFVKAVRGYFQECFTKPYYLWFFAGSNLAMLATSPVNLYSVFFAKSLHMNMGSYGKYIAYTYVISLCLTYLLGILADRFHPLRVCMIVIALYGLTTLWGGLFAVSPGTYAFALVAHGVISGTYFTCAASLGQRLLPKESFAQIASASGIVGASFNMVLPPVLGYLLDLSHHDYRLTYLAGTVLSFIALGCLGVLYRKWRQLGGPHHFVAPA